MNFVNMELARRLEVAAHSELVPTENAAIGKNGTVRIAIAGGIAAFAGVNSPVTQAEGLGLHGPVREEEFERLEEFFRSRGSSVILEVCPMADPAFVEALGKRGYRVVEFSNVLIRGIEVQESFRTGVAGVTVRKAEPHEGWLFAETVARGFADHFEVSEEIIATIQGFFTGSSNGSYLAFCDGAVAGGATLTKRNGVAGLFGTSTLPEFRKRGVQAALIAARLEASREMGCDVAMSITQPSSGSQRNLERFGFRVIYTRAKFIRDWA